MANNGIRCMDIYGGKRMTRLKRNYKDGMFRMLFSEKEKMIELYNAVTDSDYGKDTEVEVVTLDDAIFGDVKNDLTFIIDSHYMVMTEHQSTINPNMPLRMLGYSTREFERRDIMRKLYSKRLVKIPVPELYVIYNGREDQPMRQELKLSDAFMVKCDKIAIEAKVEVININYDKDPEILKKSRTLYEYSRFVHMMRQKQEQMGREEAAEEVVRECLEEGILTEFIKKNGGDIMDLVNIELTREECEAIREQDGYERGIEQGTLDEQRKIAKNMKAKGMEKQLIAELTGLDEKEIAAL